MKAWNLKQLSEKTAFLVVFSTLSRYCLVSHWTELAIPELLLFSFLFDCPSQSEQSISLGTVVHEGVDGAIFKLLDLEKVNNLH